MSLEELGKLAKESLERSEQYGTFYEVLYSDPSGRFKKGEIGILVETFTDYKYDISVCFGTGYCNGIFGRHHIHVFHRTFMFRMSEVRLVGEYVKLLKCIQCGEDIGVPRKGEGRQKELCPDCRVANRKKYRVRENKIRREKRLSNRRKKV